ncbi:hypothetical protein [Mycobacterium sp. HNNTM2301]
MELAGVGIWSSQLRYGDPLESADHVCVQVLLEDPNALPREQWRRIAAAL